MEDAIWEKGVKQRDLSKEKIEALAKEVGLDMTRFSADLEGDDCVQWIQSSQEELHTVGTNGTPAFYINGRYLSGNQPLEALKQVVDQELAKANKAIDGGIALASYYQTAVVQNGLKALADENGTDPHAGHDD